MNQPPDIGSADAPPTDLVSHRTRSQLSAVVREVAAAADQVGRRTRGEELIDRLTRTEDLTTRVVVCGETAAGKSRLVNALVGRPGLSPVGWSETTGCPLRIRYSAEDTATAYVSDPAGGSGTPRAVRLGEIAAYARTDSTSPASLVDVALAAPILEDLVLIDTPGVGGLDSGFGDLALRLADDSDALVFVHSGTAPLLEPELAFLSAAAERLAAIAVAVTKTDLSSEAADIVAETKTRLGSVPRLDRVPVFPVSAPLAELSRSTDRLDGANLSALGGVATLTQFLRSDVTTRVDRVRLAKLARQTSATATALAEQLRPKEPTVDPAAAMLDAEQSRLGRLLDDGAVQRTRTELSHLVQRAQFEPRNQFEDATIPVRRALAAEARSAGRADLARLPARVEGALAATAAEAFAAQERLFTELTTILAERLDLPDAASALRKELGSESAADLDIAAPGSPFKVRGQALFAVMSGVGVAKLATMAAATVLTGPLGWVAGGVVGSAAIGGMLYRSSQVSSRDLQVHLSRWVEQAVGEARSGVARELQRRAYVVQQLVDRVVLAQTAAIAARRRDLVARRNALTHKPAVDRDAQSRNHLLRLAETADRLAAELTNHPSGDATSASSPGSSQASSPAPSPAPSPGSSLPRPR